MNSNSNSNSNSNANFKSVEDEIEFLTNSKTQQHLSHAQARGIIPLFNFYFKQKNSNGRTKRLSREEKQKKFKQYKSKVYLQYNRLVKGSFNSESALIKRYSDPICFLKYKLKRVRNLLVDDLSPQDQDYYKEIGGLTDVEMTMYKQANIDSISKTADIAFNGGPQIGHTPSPKRRRFNGMNQSEENNDYLLDLTASQHSDIPSHSLSNRNISNSALFAPKMEEHPMNDALNKLNAGMTEYEEEQMQKKKELAVLLTNEKTKAYMQMYKLQLSAHPEILGLLPSSSLPDQLTAGFDLWLFEFKHSIRGKVMDINQFINEITLLRTDERDWNAFLQKWKLHRIFHTDSFLQVWEFVVQELDISVRTEIINEMEEVHLDLNASAALPPA